MKTTRNFLTPEYQKTKEHFTKLNSILYDIERNHKHIREEENRIKRYATEDRIAKDISRVTQAVNEISKYQERIKNSEPLGEFLITELLDQEVITSCIKIGEYRYNLTREVVVHSFQQVVEAELEYIYDLEKGAQKAELRQTILDIYNERNGINDKKEKLQIVYCLLLRDGRKVSQREVKDLSIRNIEEDLNKLLS